MPSMTSSAEQDVGSDVGIMLNNSVLYNAMIHPFTKMVIKGALWYQGIHVYFLIKVPRDSL